MIPLQGHVLVRKVRAVEKKHGSLIVPVTVTEKDVLKAGEVVELPVHGFNPEKFNDLMATLAVGVIVRFPVGAGYDLGGEVLLPPEAIVAVEQPDE